MNNIYPSDWPCKCGHNKVQHESTLYPEFNNFIVYKCVSCSEVSPFHKFTPIDNLTYVEQIAKTKEESRGVQMKLIKVLLILSIASLAWAYRPASKSHEASNAYTNKHFEEEQFNLMSAIDTAINLAIDAGEFQTYINVIEYNPVVVDGEMKRLQKDGYRVKLNLSHLPGTDNRLILSISW